MKDRIDKVILLKDMPGFGKGSVIKIHEVSMKIGENKNPTQ